MTLAERLEAHAETLVGEAAEALGRARLQHYSGAGPDATQERVAALFAAVLQGLRDSSPLVVVEHAGRIARERFHAGFGIEEIQVAFNTLEEALWRFLTQEPTDDLTAELGAIGSLLGAGKDELARVYVELASQRHAPAVDVDALNTTM